MRINVVFIPVENFRIPPRDRDFIIKIIKKHAIRAAKLLKLKRKQLTFTLHPHWWGWGGSAESKEWIRLKIPLRWKSWRHKSSYVNEKLPEEIYHEIHHLVRNHVYSLEKNYKPHRLINSLISEGLAILFSEENLSLKVSYATYREKAIKKWFSAVRKEKWSRNYNYRAWFHGEGKPLWLGYKIGKYIIDQLKKRHPNLTARKLARADTKKILKLSGVKL